MKCKRPKTREQLFKELLKSAKRTARKSGVNPINTLDKLEEALLNMEQSSAPKPEHTPLIPKEFESEQSKNIHIEMPKVSVPD